MAERGATNGGEAHPRRLEANHPAVEADSTRGEALHQWVAQNPEFSLAADFVDEGISAYAPADRRPGFCDMISFCRKNKVAFILVHKLDRFSRNREESILFKGLLRKHGVQVKSVSENFDPESPQGFLYEGMIEVINQFYSMNLATETLKGMRENASRGWVNGGFAPYGYRRVKITDAGGGEHFTYVLGDDDHVAVVREIFHLATEEGLGAKVIAHRLNERGVLAPGGGRWRQSTVGHILQNSVYVGDLEWMKTKKKGRTGRTRTGAAERVVVPDAHPPIIDREVFERRRAAAKTRLFSVHSSPHRHVNYLLGRLIRCDCCDNAFVGRRREYTNRKGEKQTALAYYCSGYLTQGKSVCSSLPLDMAWIEGVVVDTLRARFTDPAGWGELESRLRARIDERRRKYGVDPKAAQAKLADIDRKVQNYYRAIGDGLDPLVCKQLIADLQTKRGEIEEEMKTLLREDYYVVALEKNLAQLARFRARLSDGFERLPFGVQRRIVLEFVEGIRIRERREVIIQLKVRLNNEGITHLNDEVEAVDKGTWSPRNDEGFIGATSADEAPGPIVQSDPRWYPRLESNQRPAD